MTIATMSEPDTLGTRYPRAPQLAIGLVVSLAEPRLVCDNDSLVGQAASEVAACLADEPTAKTLLATAHTSARAEAREIDPMTQIAGHAPHIVRAHVG
jgi:hypothetical protein